MAVHNNFMFLWTCGDFAWICTISLVCCVFIQFSYSTPQWWLCLGVDFKTFLFKQCMHSYKTAPFFISDVLVIYLYASDFLSCSSKLNVTVLTLFVKCHLSSVFYIHLSLNHYQNAETWLICNGIEDNSLLSVLLSWSLLPMYAVKSL